MSELVPKPDGLPALNAQEAQLQVSQQISRGLLPALTQMADELEARGADGRMVDEIAKLKLTSILNQMGRILQAVNTSLPKMNVNVNVDAKDATWLRSKSINNHTPAQVEAMRKAARKERHGQDAPQ